MKMKQSVRLISAMNKKRLNHCMEKKKESWLIITDINLFNDDLLLIRVRQKKVDFKFIFFSNLGFSFIFN